MELAVIDLRTGLLVQETEEHFLRKSLPTIIMTAISDRCTRRASVHMGGIIL
jgi:hypothetical protein